MLFSYQQANEAEGLPRHTRRFAQAALKVSSPQGLVLGTQAFESFLDAYGVGSEVEALLEAITDQASVERVEYEVSRRIVTGRIPDDLADAINEAREILSMDEQLNISDIPLVAMLSTDHEVGQMPVIINIVGKKAIADAIRTLWSRAFKHPYPNGIPKCAIVLYRMPPATTTVEVKVDEQVQVDAVQGWGRFVQASEVSDMFVLDRSGTLKNKDVRTQDSMVYRNPRTGEIVQTRPSDAESQTITDDLARTLALQTIRCEVGEAVFGVGEEKSWLLGVGSAGSQETVPVEQVSKDPFIDEEDELPEENEVQPAIEIIELEEQPEPQVEIEEAEPEPVIDDPMRGPADASSSSVQNTYEDTLAQAQHLLESVYATIDKILRDWLHGDQPDAFDDLVNRVSGKRQVPYKNRLLTLHEMKSQGAFGSPSPEAVRFALETLERFRKEF